METIQALFKKLYKSDFKNSDHLICKSVLCTIFILNKYNSEKIA